MWRRLNVLIDPLLTPSRAPWVFMLGIVLFSLLANAIYDWLFARVGSPLTIGLVAALSIVVLALVTEWYRRRLRRTLVSVALQPRRGLVVLVSQGTLREGATESAIHYHYRGKNDEERPAGALRYCWLLTSPSEPVRGNGPEAEPPLGRVSAWANATYLVEKYAGRIEMHVVQIDPNDPVDVYHKVENVLREAEDKGLGRNDLAVNFKGGTKEMSVGMVLAATTHGYSVETTLPGERDADGYRKAGSPSEVIMLDLRPILQSDTD